MVIVLAFRWMPAQRSTSRLGAPQAGAPWGASWLSTRRTAANSRHPRRGHSGTGFSRKIRAEPRGQPPTTLRATPREIPCSRKPTGRLAQGTRLPALAAERFGGERGVEQERLGVVYAQIADGRQRLEGHIAGLVAGLVGSQPLQGAVARAAGVGCPAQVMAGQGQQELVEGRRIGPRGGPFQDGGGRR